MEQIAEKKLHFAPYRRQQRAIKRLIREGKYRNPTHFLRCAIDHYLDRLGRPTLMEQARQMAADYHRAAPDREGEPSRLQDASRQSPEEW
jgi:Arc/MetJ-type ribon-helix-helix transcriptional regulator